MRLISMLTKRNVISSMKITWTLNEEHTGNLTRKIKGKVRVLYTILNSGNIILMLVESQDALQLKEINKNSTIKAKC